MTESNKTKSYIINLYTQLR